MSAYVRLWAHFRRSRRTPGTSEVRALPDMSLGTQMSSFRGYFPPARQPINIAAEASVVEGLFGHWKARTDG